MLKEYLVYSSMRLGVPFIAPRRMEEDTKHPLSIIDHSHFILAHLFDILVI